MKSLADKSMNILAGVSVLGSSAMTISGFIQDNYYLLFGFILLLNSLSIFSATWIQINDSEVRAHLFEPIKKNRPGY